MLTKEQRDEILRLSDELETAAYHANDGEPGSRWNDILGPAKQEVARKTLVAYLDIITATKEQT